MAIKTVAELKAYFNTGDKPTESEFSDLIDTIFYMARPYNVYTASLSQAGTDAPTSIIKENNLGITPNYAYEDVGYYIVSGTGIGDMDIIVGNSSTSDAVISIQRIDSDSFGIFITTDFGSTGIDDVLFKTLIEIRYYN